MSAKLSKRINSAIDDLERIPATAFSIHKHRLLSRKLISILEQSKRLENRKRR